jgi:hypothetical protein
MRFDALFYPLLLQWRKNGIKKEEKKGGKKEKDERKYKKPIKKGK